MKLYIVRHGETDWNKSRRIQGQVDIPLNEFGKTLAKKTANGLKDISFDVCITSPLSRAKETARLILEGRDVLMLEDSRIMEMAFGSYEGKCLEKDRQEVPEEFYRFFDDPEHFIPGEDGETFADVKKRTGEFLQDLYQRREYEQSNILITTHGAALAGMLNYIKNAPLCAYWGQGVHKNCAVTEVQVTNGIPEILSENVVYYDDEVEDWDAGSRQ